jgi:hypothetical protein
MRQHILEPCLWLLATYYYTQHASLCSSCIRHTSTYYNIKINLQQQYDLSEREIMLQICFVSFHLAKFMLKKSSFSCLQSLYKGLKWLQIWKRSVYEYITSGHILQLETNITSMKEVKCFQGQGEGGIKTFCPAWNTSRGLIAKLPGHNIENSKFHEQ